MNQNARENIVVWIKSILIIFGCISSWLIFGYGLLHPLTPSDASPRLINIIIYWGLPLSTLLFCWYVCNNTWAKLGIFIQGIVIFGLYGFLLLPFILRVLLY